MSTLGRRPRGGRAGFSLIEAIVAAGILGVALVGLVELHKGSMRGTIQAQRIGQATEVARQIAELTAAQSLSRLPACAPGINAQLAAPPNGCRATATPSTVYAAVRPNGCTFYTDSAAVAPADPAAFPDAGAAKKYRVDVAVSQHPDPTNFPNNAMLTVWVCWQEEGGMIREISTTRIIW